jgi:hypothetical protein
MHVWDEDLTLSEVVDGLDPQSPALRAIEDMDDMLSEFFKTHPFALATYLANRLDGDFSEFAKEDFVAFVSYGEPVFKHKNFAGVGWITYQQFLDYLEY